jgi:uncharacterized protein (TIGR02757 family)
MAKLSNEIVDTLNEAVVKYNKVDFIQNDPISIPHNYTKKLDVEIMAFFMSTIAWGKRESIIKSGKWLMEIMGESPYDFIMSASEKDIYDSGFYYRTFQPGDYQYFCYALKQIYTNKSSLEDLFVSESGLMRDCIGNFKKSFFAWEHESRAQKHIGDPFKGSAAKRIVMFLRWMVRKDNNGVDFGIWDRLNMSDLCCPLDVHSGRTARNLGILKRAQNDWKTVDELQESLVKLDANDPSKYDFALFGIGVNS